MSQIPGILGVLLAVGVTIYHLFYRLRLKRLESQIYSEFQEKNLPVKTSPQEGNFANLTADFLSALDIFETLRNDQLQVQDEIQNLMELLEKITSNRDFSQRSHLSQYDILSPLARQIEAMCQSMEQSSILQLKQRSFLEKMIGESSRKPPQAMFEIGFRELIRLTRAQTALLYTLDHDGKYRPSESHGVDINRLSHQAYSPGEGLVGKVAEMPELLEISFPEDGRGLDIDTGFYKVPPRYLYFVPILSGSSTRAVVAFGLIEPLEEHLKEVTMALARQLSIGYENAYHTEKATQKAREIQRKNREILEQKQKLQEINVQLEEASRHKSEFLASMSHELRTPLNAMIGYTSLVLNTDDNLEEETRQNLIYAEESARTLLQLINDVLDFSKIEAGKMDLYITECSLEDIIEEVLLTTRGLLLEEDLQVVTEVETSLPLLATDPTKIKQILNNLLGNAVKFTDEGKIWVRARQKEDSVEVEVEDSGCGIPPEKARTIFESFRQVDGSSKKKFGGTGLGLAITKKLCDLLSIEIDLESEVGVGTKITLEIPLEVSSDKTGDEEGEEAKEIEAPREKESPTLRKETRPLLSKSEGEKRGSFDEEDSSENLAVVAVQSNGDTKGTLEKALTGLPLSVEVVTSEEDILGLARQSRLWATVIEPDGQGFEILSQIKKNPELASIPTLMCSARENRQLGKMGMVEWISKPLDSDQLLGAILRLTDQKDSEILVVEDDEKTRELYEKILSQQGFQLHLASNGLEAIEYLLNSHLPQAILLDLHMPAMDGFEVLEAMKEHQIWQKVPVIVATGRDLSKEERKFLEEGSEALLEKKNFSLDELSHQIWDLFQGVFLSKISSILIVDDNEVNLRLMGQIFRKEGFTVYQANSGKEGLELAWENGPDIILMDLAMPEMDGFELTRRLKTHPATSKSIVIACSAFALDEFAKKAKSVGCEGFITKPIEPNHLVSQVQREALAAKIRRQPTWKKS